jgi:UDP-2,3-diacylglucosamine pyrophosphatase LpxH
MNWIALSDLHISSAPGQFQAHQALGTFLGRVAHTPALSGVVLAGDVLDFLEFESHHEIVPKKASQRLDDILSATPNKPIVEGLKAVLEVGRVVVLPGNHDVELDLPAVQETMRDLLDADERLQFEPGGQAFQVTTEHGKAWFTHGNKFDVWNDIDYAAFREGATRDPERPQKLCPGSRLVLELMNQFKGDYPWIDRVSHLPTAVALLWYFEKGSDRVKQALRRSTGLGPDLLLQSLRRLRRGGMLAAAPAPHDVLADHLLRAFCPDAPQALRQEQWFWMESVVTEGIGAASPGKLAAGGGERYWLAVLRHLLEASTPARVEHEDPSHEDPIEHTLKKRVPHDASVVVMGHTHVEKDRPLGDGRYLNLGCWGEQLDIPPFAHDEDLQRWLTALRANEVPSTRRPTFLTLEDADGLSATLAHADA